MKLSNEPAVAATLTAGLGTAVAVGAFLNAADMPAGWDWMETVLPVGIFVLYAIVGLVIRPLVTPNAKLLDPANVDRPGGTGNWSTGTGTNVRKVGGYRGGDSGGIAPAD